MEGELVRWPRNISGGFSRTELPARAEDCGGGLRLLSARGKMGKEQEGKKYGKGRGLKFVGSCENQRAGVRESMGGYSS